MKTLAPVADVAAQVAAERDRRAADPGAGPVEPRHLAVDGDAEATQDVAPARRAVEGVGAGVEVEAVAVAAAGPAAEVLGALDDGDGVAGAGQRGGGGQAGEPAPDDDRACVLHASETIDRPAL